MTDCKNLDLARQWAADINADRQTLSQDTIDAAADLISSLPDEWVDADTLREIADDMANWRLPDHASTPEDDYRSLVEIMSGFTARLTELLEPTPRTLAEMDVYERHDHKWSQCDVKGQHCRHVIISVRDEGATLIDMNGLVITFGLDKVTPLPDLPRMQWPGSEPDDVAAATGGELTTQDVVDECRAVRKERATPEQQALARDIFGNFPSEERHVHWAKPISKPASPRPEDVPVGEPWQVEVEGQVAIGYRNGPGSTFPWATIRGDDPAADYCDDVEVTLIARLALETTEQDDVPEFDPAYTYSDKDGDEWEYLDGRWVTGDTHAERVDTREGMSGHYSLPEEYGPYTRIEA